MVTVNGKVIAYSIHAGPRERALARSHRPSSPVPIVADLDHARHADNCPVCADDDKCHEALTQERDQYRGAYEALISGLHLIRRTQNDPERRRDMESVLKDLETLTDRAARIMRG